MKTKTYIRIILAELATICTLFATMTFGTDMVDACATTMIWAVIFSLTFIHFDDIWTYVTTMDEKSEG